MSISVMRHKTTKRIKTCQMSIILQTNQNQSCVKPKDVKPELHCKPLLLSSIFQHRLSCSSSHLSCKWMHHQHQLFSRGFFPLSRHWRVWIWYMRPRPLLPKPDRGIPVRLPPRVDGPEMWHQWVFKKHFSALIGALQFSNFFWEKHFF